MPVAHEQLRIARVSIDLMFTRHGGRRPMPLMHEPARIWTDIPTFMGQEHFRPGDELPGDELPGDEPHRWRLALEAGRHWRS